MVDPKLLCDRHLLGEHGELHKHRHSFVKQFSIAGRLDPVVQIQPKSMEIRHNQLAREMLHRGFQHNSPYALPDLSYLGRDRNRKVDISISISDLRKRCSDCKSRIQNA